MYLKTVSKERLRLPSEEESGLLKDSILLRSLDDPMEDIRLDILAIGSLVREGNVINEAHSTSTLIRTDEMTLVVDTSSNYMRPVIKSSLRDLKVLPKEVDAVILTHGHHDHAENNDIFPRAEIYIREEEEFDGGKRIKKDLEICKNVRLMHTPGHTEGSMSVFVDSERRYAIAGDAIPLEENYRKMLPPRINVNEEKAMKSIKFITEYADVIVPGHGFPFMKEV